MRQRVPRRRNSNRLQTLFRTFRDVTWDLELARRDFHRIAVEAIEHLAITDALLGRRRAGRVAGDDRPHPLGRDILDSGDGELDGTAE